MNTTTPMTLYEKVKKVVRVISITVGTLMLFGYALLFALIVAL